MIVLYEDCRIQELSFREPLTPRAEGKPPGRVIIPPKCFIKCKVVVPEIFQHPAHARNLKAHIPSTLARIGLHTFVDEKRSETLLGLQKIITEIWVTLVNWGSVAVLFSMSRRITLSNLRVVNDNPVEVLSLHAGDEYLAIRDNELAHIPAIGGREFPCINPDDPLRFESCFQTLALTPRELSPLDFYVFGTQKFIPVIPENHIGIISPVPPELEHSSATIIYPGTEGRIALEFSAQQNFFLEPGLHVANLAIYEASNHLPEYNGKYKYQESIKPQFSA